MFSKFILYYKITKKIDKCYLIKSQTSFKHHSGRYKSIVCQNFHFPIYLNDELIILNTPLVSQPHSSKTAFETFNHKFSTHIDYFDYKGHFDKDRSHEIETINPFLNILLVKLFKKMKTSMKTYIEVQDTQALNDAIKNDLIVINREKKLNELI